RIFKPFQHPAGLAYRDVCPVALRQETVPCFLTCTAPGTTCTPVPPFSKPVEALPDLLLGSHTVAYIGAVDNIQGSASIPVDQDVPGIVHTLAGSLGARLRGLHIIHLIQDDPTTLRKFLSQFFKFTFSGNPHRIPPRPYIHFFQSQVADKSLYSGSVHSPRCRPL